MKEGIINFLKEILFPIFCVECGKEGEWWCRECRQKIYFLSNNKAIAPLDGITALFKYEENNYLAKLIHLFKYQYASDTKNLWGEIIDSALKNCLQKKDPALCLADLVIIPIPLHSRRQRERGFNQAEVLAELLFSGLRKTRRDVNLDKKNLKRKRYTIQQAKLSGEERRKNLLDAFIWNKETKISQHVLLVDDVYTTGATMSECAKELKTAGANSVYGFVLARG